MFFKLNILETFNYYTICCKYIEIILKFKLKKRVDFTEKQLWWVQLYSSDGKNANINDEYDEFEVMRQNSPWPKRNHNCFYFLNVFMER